jgi:transglycosylase-like protein with SLT domain
MSAHSEGPGEDALVIAAIRNASQATGMNFDYLLTMARIESGLNPHARAPTSSACGLFQFLEQTWLSTVKAYGTRYGYGRHVEAIVRTVSGRYEVFDAVQRQEILDLRYDPAASALMASAFTQANAAVLTLQLDRAPNEGELYIAHFLGANGAARLIKLAANRPDGKAAESFSDAAHANFAIFYDRATGAPRTFAQVRDELVSRYDRQRSNPVQRD